jgi:hypothetical protein
MRQELYPSERHSLPLPEEKSKALSPAMSPTAIAICESQAISFWLSASQRLWLTTHSSSSFRSQQHTCYLGRRTRESPERAVAGQFQYVVGTGIAKVLDEMDGR